MFKMFFCKHNFDKETNIVNKKIGNQEIIREESFMVCKKCNKRIMTADIITINNYF